MYVSIQTAKEIHAGAAHSMYQFQVNTVLGRNLYPYKLHLQLADSTRDIVQPIPSVEW
jgi:hypothetical protein